MAVESIEALMIAIQTLYPVTYSEKQIPMATERYRLALKGMSPFQLDDAWNKLALVWTKRTAPTPADILAAAGKTESASNSEGSGMSLKAKLERRDAERLEDRRNLIDRYEREHARGYEMARVEGWLGYLSSQVKRSANIIAQRNELRRTGSVVPDWVPDVCDIVLTSESSQTAIEKVEKFVPWCSIITVDGVDHIEIAQHTLKVWRAEAAIPGPAAKKPVKQTVLQTLAHEVIETASAA